MAKHCVRWKPIRAKTFRGSDFWSPYPDAIEASYRGRLLGLILAMEKKQPISFEQAARMAAKKFDEAVDSGRIGYGPEECNWFHQNFVEWIGSLGYHIELTGDEFEPYFISDKIL